MVSGHWLGGSMLVLCLLTWACASCFAVIALLPRRCSSPMSFVQDASLLRRRLAAAVLCDSSAATSAEWALVWACACCSPAQHIGAHCSSIPSPQAWQAHQLMFGEQCASCS